MKEKKEDKMETLSKTIKNIKKKEDRETKGYQKNVMYSLDGRLLKEDGSVQKTDFFSFLDMNLDNYSDITLTADEAGRLRKHVQAASTGVQSLIPLICAGDKCKFKERCPLYEMGKPPVGRQCLPEVELLTFFRKRFIEEYNVNPQDMTDLTMVNELAEIEIFEMRCNIALSKEDGQDLTQNNIVGVTNLGAPYHQTVVHTAWDIKERLKIRKMKLVECMVGSRKEKWKRAAALKTRDTGDPSSQMSNFRAELESLKDEIEMTQVEAAKDITEG